MIGCICIFVYDVAGVSLGVGVNSGVGVGIGVAEFEDFKKEKDRTVVRNKRKNIMYKSFFIFF